MSPQQKKHLIKKLVKAEAKRAAAIADRIADLAEPPFREMESAKLLADYLCEHDFDVSFGYRQMPSAFRASWGKGKPVVGMLAEYDALPNCGAKEGTWGHGCGHNLLGTGSTVAAVAARKALEGRKLKGQVVLYGCPAEETLAGKVYMARDGAFADLDAALAWHPGSGNGVNNAGGSALDSIVLEFFGRTAHGASAHGGRSALDGVMLTDVAVNYLREHVTENVRIHMAVLDGGDAPNVVPAYARCWYYVRAKDRAQVDDVRRRLTACARGAAQATETRLKVTLLAGIYNRLPNDAMANAAMENMKLFGPPRATAADVRRASKKGKRAEFGKDVAKGFGTQGRASSDEDTVSWLTPLGRYNVACVPKNVTGHHRDYAMQVKAPFAHRGALRAAEVLAATAFDLCADGKLLGRVRKEFTRRTKGFTFDPLVPKRQRPPIEFP